MKETIIHVSDIFCKYPNGKMVLEVEEFKLHKGEVVFLLGPSGIGKSTFIEAIGLINNTAVARANSQIMYHLDTGEKVDIIHLWKSKKENIEKFRREHFSFIFQNNYLMPNLTAGENMMLTLLMKGDSEIKAEQKIQELMQVVRLQPDVINKSIFNVSGGQKQRLAFVRAVASPFEILIGDEPTGNLDAITAHALMAFTRNEIIKENKSGVFVSHDIHLALQYADRIYLFLPKNTENGLMGHLASSAMLQKNENRWYQGDKEISVPGNYVQNLFQEII
jgi:ABC-type lipoprotein export system ATPase subunit